MSWLIVCSLTLACQLQPVIETSSAHATVRHLDVTGDGLLDKLTFDADGTVSVSVNVGTKTFLLIRQDLPTVKVTDVLVSDLDGDGLPDLYLVSPQRNVALLGDGVGFFRDATSALGLTDAGVGRSAERIDVDADGLIDLLLHNAGSDALFWAIAPGHFERDSASTDGTDMMGRGVRGSGREATSTDGGKTRATPPTPDSGPTVGPTASRTRVSGLPASPAGFAFRTPSSQLDPDSPMGQHLTGAAEGAALSAHDVFAVMRFDDFVDLSNAQWLNDGAGEVGAADIADGSLTGADVSTSSGDVTFPGAVLTAQQGVFGVAPIVTGIHATVSGGNGNRAYGYAATVGGGRFHSAFGIDSTVGGGEGNAALGSNATVGGGDGNMASGGWATIGGGQGNTATFPGATVSGGRYNSASRTNSTVGGGRYNTASDHDATVGGGKNNTASKNYSTVGGGLANDASGSSSTIGGGNYNGSLGSTSTIGGGSGNIASGGGATIGGGGGNTASAAVATVGGGVLNTASGSAATLGGGQYNVASGDLSTVGGGLFNASIGYTSTVPGGRLNHATGDFSFASGRRAKADHDGAFVWGDSFDGNKTSSAADQFNVYASGGTRIFSNTAATSGVLLAAGGNSWSAVSDRAAKEHLEPVDVRAVLDAVAAMPITTWNYKTQDDSVRHMGPMAQDFRAAFGLGVSDRLIDTIDPDGVALAAIQGLNEVVVENEAEIEGLRTIVEELKTQVAELMQR